MERDVHALGRQGGQVGERFRKGWKLQRKPFQTYIVVACHILGIHD